VRELKMQHPPIEVVVPCVKGERKYSACGTCGQIVQHNDEFSLNQCRCIPRICDCGAPTYYDTPAMCKKCYDAHEAADIAQRAIEAKKVSLADYAESHVYCEEYDKYLECDALDDFIIDELTDEDEVLDLDKLASLHFFGIEEIRVGFDAVDLVNDFVEGLHLDDYSGFSKASISELQAMLDTWCTENRDECFAIEADYNVLVDVATYAKEEYPKHR